MPSYRAGSLRAWLISVDKTVQRELRQVVETTSQETKDYLAGVTASWEHKVQFRRVMVVRPNRIRATVIPTGSNKKIFQYVDQGTGKWGPKHAPYKIKAKSGGLLKFKGSYDARSNPSAGPGSAPQANVGTGKAIGGWRSAKEVIHPGIRPRKFAESFEAKLQPDFRTRVVNALKRAARRH